MALQGAVTAWGLKDTSSRPPKDLGGTLRRTSRTTLRSYDSRASGDQKCPHCQGSVASVASKFFKVRYHALATLVASAQLVEKPAVAIKPEQVLCVQARPKKGKISN